MKMAIFSGDAADVDDRTGYNIGKTTGSDFGGLIDSGYDWRYRVAPFWHRI